MLSELSPLTCFECGLVDDLISAPHTHEVKEEHPCDCLCDDCMYDECKEDWCNTHQQTESECTGCNPLEKLMAEDFYIENLIDEMRFEA